ncbi:hypothetical protein [Actinomadura sp. KC216]|uniref:hypothetical protein n=1 Tax=Actinomadura sp. KC216 TaxID=2530370 RepID=UPI001FB8034E|nr:hypothetical protein [Actinomadura sp. KC216]
MAEIPPFEPNPAAYRYAEMADHLQLKIEAGRLDDPPPDALRPGSSCSASGTWPRSTARQSRRRGVLSGYCASGSWS